MDPSVRVWHFLLREYIRFGTGVMELLLVGMRERVVSEVTFGVGYCSGLFTVGAQKLLRICRTPIVGWTRVLR